MTLLVFLTLLVMARPLQPPASARGVAHALGAASLARDLDLEFQAADESRYKDLVLARPIGVLLADGSAGDFATFPGNALELMWVAPFVRLAGLRGAQLAHVLALSLAIGLAASTLHSRIDTAWRILLTALFASVVPLFFLEPRPEALTLAAVVAAFALVYRGEAPRFEELSEVFDDRSRRRPFFALRWSVVGFLLGVAVLAHPLYLLLLIPAWVGLTPVSRRAGAVLMAVGVLAAVGLGVMGGLLMGASLPWMTPLGLFDATSGFPGLGSEWAARVPIPSIVEAAQPVFDLPLLGWNLLFVGVGRSTGVLPYFLPVLLLLALWQPEARRSTLVVVVALAAVLAVAIWPFDHAGDAILGNALLLPLFGALWLVPTRRCSIWGPLVVLAVAGLLLWPSWIHSIGLWSGGAGPGNLASPIASRWLPHESTRRPMGGDFVVQNGVRALPAGGGVSQRQGDLYLRGGSWGNLVIASSRPLSRVYLAFDGQAGTELEVAGGTLGDMLFRGDGGLGFEIELEDHARRHRMWWSSEPQSLYDLRLRLPRAPDVPISFGVEGDTEP